MCPAEALSLLLAVGWVALLAALAIGSLALLAIVSRPVRVAAERPLGRFAARHVRASHGIAIDAPRWACRACRSVNEATATTCYRCGAAASDAAQPIPAPVDETWRAVPPPNRFDPSRYRGPGAPPEPEEPADVGSGDHAPGDGGRPS